MKRFKLFILFIAAAVMAASAATFSVIPPRKAVEGEKFAVTFRLDNGQGSDVRISQINGCTLIYGPSTSTSSSYQVINGKASSSMRMEYTCIYRADHAGTFTIPAASVVCDGKRLTTKPVKFTVETRAQANTPASRRPVDIDDAETQSSDRPVRSGDVFVRIILSKPSVYEQEAVECTIKLYTKYNISQFIPTKQPAFDGFLMQEVDVRPELNREETYNGGTYYTAVLKKVILYPQRSGSLTITSGNYDLNVIQYDNIRMGGFMTVRQPRERSIKVTSNSATVSVKALPQPKPAGFSGAVGSFTAESRLVGNKFLTNDPATLIYTISGTGNIKFLKEPVIDFPDEFEQYTPKSNIDARVSGNDMTGTMTVEYTFVPQTVGEFTIGTGEFVYFNPSAGQYVTLKTPTYNIKVGKGAAAAASRDQEEISAKNTDILHIRPAASGLSHSHTLVVLTWWYWLFFLIPLLGLGVAIAVNRERLRLAADVKGQRLAKAGKLARRRLTKAEGYLKGRREDLFYEEILRALNDFLCDKLMIPQSQLSRERVVETLEHAGVDAGLISRLTDLTDRAEMARYTPQTPAMADEVYRGAIAVINELNSCKNLKKVLRK